LPVLAVSQLDRLTTTFVFGVGGETWQVHETIEVCGGHVLSLTQASTHNTLGKQPLHLIEQVRISAERALENRCGYAFVPRYERIGPIGRRAAELLLYRPGGQRALLEVRRLVGVEPASLVPSGALITVSKNGIARGLERVAPGALFLHIEHGLDSPPDEADHACLLLAADQANTARNRSLLRAGRSDGSFEVFASQDRAGAGAFVIPDVESFAARNEVRTVI
jgi:hypothetical protein